MHQTENQPHSNLIPANPGQTNPEKALEIAAESMRSGRLSQARDHLESILEHDPDNYQALFMLGRIFMTYKNYPEAIGVHTKLVDHHPQDAKAHNALGTSLVMDGQNDQATRHFQRAVELAPQNRAYLANWGKLLMMQERWEEAEQSLQRARAFAQGTALVDIENLLVHCRTNRMLAQT
jgi:Tfp pilus assembly protein PilF